jgi:hypothetical protein
MIAGGEPVEFDTDIEILALDTDHCVSPRSPAEKLQLRRCPQADVHAQHTPD